MESNGACAVLMTHPIRRVATQEFRMMNGTSWLSRDTVWLTRKRWCVMRYSVLIDCVWPLRGNLAEKTVVGPLQKKRACSGMDQGSYA